MQSWFTAKELQYLQSAPSSAQGVNKKARQQGWEKRKVEGVQGNGVEYAFSSLPEEIQAELLVKNAAQQAEQAEETRSEPKQANYLPEVIWQGFDSVSSKKREDAKKRLATICALADLIESGSTFSNALTLVAEKSAFGAGSIKRWYYSVKQFNRSDWLPILLSKHGKNRKSLRAEFTQAAWEFFKADYLRNETPQFGSCYERLKLAAVQNGWEIPTRSSVYRRLHSEFSKTEITYLRDGEYALSKLHPDMIRSVESLEAMEWINGDGYQHNVFVEWMNGEVVRPKTWVWQDIRTRKILAYRVDLSENSDTIRLALKDLIEQYGIPKHLTIDNTRAAANKWLTGGVPNRYRFKVKEDEVKGIIPMLDIKLHWTSIKFGKGRGQAKPVERAFSHGGLGELVDKHPSLAGFHTGDSVMNKPDNYNGGKAGVDYATFMAAVENGIRMFNERTARKTEICQGIYSFSDVFARDYAQASVRKASPEQLRLLMLMSEAVTLKSNGTFELGCGGKVYGRKNRYEAAELIGTSHKKVVIKFDPEQLHSNVFVYSLDGVFLSEAVCTEKAGFGDKAAGREHDKKLNQFVKANKAAAKAKMGMDALEAARYLQDYEDEPTPQTSVIEMLRPAGNTVKRELVEHDEDESPSVIEQGLTNYFAMIKNDK